MKSKKATNKRIRELEEELEGHRKKAKAASAAISEEYICPISLELFVDPVRAEDGFDYERSDIEQLIRRQGKDLTSPQTGKKMGPSLAPSYAVKNAVEALVNTGTISGDLADHYKQSKLRIETKQKAENGDANSMKLLSDWYKVGSNGLPIDPELSDEWRKKAEKAKDDELITATRAAAAVGDSDAMYDLGHAYENGLRGLSENKTRAFEWYQKAADAMSPAGIAMMASFLIDGLGGAKVDVSHGKAQMFYAAAAGSDFACREVGVYYLYGMHGTPEDKVKALHFLQRATDGSCAIAHMNQEDLEEAKQALKQLQESQSTSNTVQL